MRAEGVEAIADAVLQLWFTPRTHRDEPALVRAYRAMMVSAAREGYAGCCEALADWDPGDELAAIRAPDARARRRARIPRRRPPRPRRSRGRIAGARLRVLEGAGHLANLEQPEAFNRLLLEHLTARAAVEVA